MKNLQYRKIFFGLYFKLNLELVKQNAKCQAFISFLCMCILVPSRRLYHVVKDDDFRYKKTCIHAQHCKSEF